MDKYIKKAEASNNPVGVEAAKVHFNRMNDTLRSVEKLRAIRGSGKSQRDFFEGCPALARHAARFSGADFVEGLGHLRDDMGLALGFDLKWSYPVGAGTCSWTR